MSYRDNTLTKNIPTRVDPKLVPSISYDLDVPRIHTRLPDGFMKPADMSLETKDVGICTKPVSILRKMTLRTRKAYGSESIVVSVDSYAVELA